jgi:NitT/TauT family transport system permease protein
MSRDYRGKITLYRFVALGVIILLWWLASETARANVVPSPLATFWAAVALVGDGKIFEALGQSLLVYTAGLLLATTVAIPVGLMMGGFRTLGRTLELYANALMATPRVAFIPLIIVLLGLGFEAKMTVVFLGAVMPILINTYAGVLNADGELVEMARSAGASRYQVFRRILLPGALPFIVVGLRLGATIGLINTIVAELYTAVTGLGGLLAFYGNTFQMARYFVVVLSLSLVGVAVTQGLRLVESRMDRWRYNAAG